MTILIGTVSYAIAAMAFLFLSVLLITTWRGRTTGMLLAGACLTTAMWAGATAYLNSRLNDAMFAVDILEALRYAAWFAFLMVLIGYPSRDMGHLRRTAVGFAVFCGIVLLATLYWSTIVASGPIVYEMLGRVVLAVIGIILVEQLYRNTDPQQRWAIKFLCVGLGGMFAYDFYLYTDALLFRRMHSDMWAARGIVNAMVVPLLAVAAARNPTWSLDVFISRRIVFHSTAMLGAAVYLLLMAAAGYYIRYFGSTWGPLLQVTFLFGAALLLVVMLFSGMLRARLKVFLYKNFFNYRYDYREEWLRFTHALSDGEPGVQLYDRSIEAIAKLVDSSGGALWLSQDGKKELMPLAHWNMPLVNEIEPSESRLCQFLEQRQWVVSLDQYHARPALYDGLEIPDWLRAIPHAWLIVPLMLHERLLGFVVLTRSRGNINLNWEVRDLLKTAGRQAASHLAQLEAANSLLEARKFESFNRMSAFLVHDLKNLVAQHTLLLSNADKHIHNPAFQEDMIETIAQSVKRMKRLLLQLRGNHTQEPTAPVKLKELLQQVVAGKSEAKPTPRLEACNGAMCVIAHPERLERVIGHLIQNAIEATPVDGHVDVQLTRKKESAVIEIADTGCGMSEQFMRDQLFKPFESTKTSGMGIGAYEAREYARELEGQIEVEAREDQGTIVRVVLPIHVPESTTEFNVPAKGQQ